MGGAIIGGVADVISGGDGSKGLMIVAGVGFGSNFGGLSGVSLAINSLKAISLSLASSAQKNQYQLLITTSAQIIVALIALAEWRDKHTFKLKSGMGPLDSGPSTYQNAFGQQIKTPGRSEALGEELGGSIIFALLTGFTPSGGVGRSGANLNAVNSVKRTGSAAYKSLNVEDAQHYYTNIVDNYASTAKKFALKGGDDVVRDLYQIQGSLRGESGIFEWIVDGGNVTHRRFIPKGVVNGIPNQFIR